MTPTLKRTLHWSGSVLAVAGIAFVILRLRGYGAEIDFARFDSATWTTVGALALIYGLSNLMLALAWWDILGQFNVNISVSWAVRTYGISQISKYVPGNIFHLAGRQAMGMAAGVAAWPLAKSSAWELGLISVAGGLLGLLAFPLLMPGVSMRASAVLYAAVLVICFALLKRNIGRRTARAFVWHTGFLIVSGLLFVGLIELLVGNYEPGVDALFLLGGAYVLAWLVGLVTPGAPAGLGVRELVLLFLLRGMINEADLLLVVLLGRVVTVVGDLIFFGVAFQMNGRAENVVG